MQEDRRVRSGTKTGAGIATAWHDGRSRMKSEPAAGRVPPDDACLELVNQQLSNSLRDEGAECEGLDGV